MTNEEAKKMLKAKLECLKRETSGTDIDCNYRNCDECNLCYEQGNMGEQKEALDMAIKALEQISHLKGRPCEVCEFHSDNGCRRWKCVFEEGNADIEADKGVLEKINEKQNSLRATCKAWDEAISRDGYVN